MAPHLLGSLTELRGGKTLFLRAATFDHRKQTGDGGDADGDSSVFIGYISVSTALHESLRKLFHLILINDSSGWSSYRHVTSQEKELCRNAAASLWLATEEEGEAVAAAPGGGGGAGGGAGRGLAAPHPSAPLWAAALCCFSKDTHTSAASSNANAAPSLFHSFLSLSVPESFQRLPTFLRARKTLYK